MTINSSETDYAALDQQLRALLDGEPDALANTANFTALLFGALSDVNWLGIYVLRGDELVLGPFQGKPACVRIPVGRGVCGVAADLAKSQRIDDVHEFAGHIVCDPVSKSEMVIPLLSEGRIIAVLDIDSPTRARFSAADQAGVEMLCGTFLRAIGNSVRRQPDFI